MFQLLGERKKVKEMKNGLALTALFLIVGLVLAGGVWGEKNASFGAFSGKITKVDSVSKEIAVQSHDAEMTFQWSDKTILKGPGGERLIFGELKEGMMVTVVYSGGDRNRVANRIDVTSNAKTLKGMTLPFDCGVSVC